jgi:hypothetical protein
MKIHDDYEQVYFAGSSTTPDSFLHDLKVDENTARSRGDSSIFFSDRFVRKSEGELKPSDKGVAHF